MHVEVNTSAIDIINRVLSKSIAKGCSDVHFEPQEAQLRVRCRQDGLLYEMCSFPRHLTPFLITRLKVMGNLDISEHRLPQDGRFHFEFKQNRVDCRISTCPISQGEKVVIRLLKTEQALMSLSELGMTSRQLACFRGAIHRPHGMILVTGPTGSGKTVTLYAALNEMHQSTKNILTIEDPIEIEISGINQTAVCSKIGLTFASALRAFLRQDPDIMMIGEIRDEETASMAVRAAQTGHLVLSTLHANGTIESIARLHSLGISGHHIACSLKLVVAQRLLSTLCAFCRQPSRTDGLPGYQAIGCEHCRQGYRGRTGIFEVLSMVEDLKHFILQERNDQVSAYVSQQGVETFKESAQFKLEQGLISYETLKGVMGSF